MSSSEFICPSYPHAPTHPRSFLFTPAQPSQSDLVVIGIHGLGMYPTDLIPIAEVLKDAGVTVDLLVLEGHATTLEKLNNTPYKSWLTQLHTACDAYRAQGRDVYLLGFSLGGTLALDCAHARNDIRGVIGIGTFLGYGLRTPFVLFFLRVAAFFGYPALPRSSTMRKNTALCFSSHLPLRATQQTISNAQRVVTYAQEITTPTLLLHGTADVAAPYKPVQKFFKKLPAQKHVQVYPAAGHFVQFNVKTQTLVDEILTFFSLTTARQ